MTGKTKPDEPKKEKAAEPAVAPTDDLVCKVKSKCLKRAEDGMFPNSCK